ncbi:MAG: L,D-transpeptidase [Kofleriaceae bacterium]|nr:L,D-transpeptidase [Kofleriaceae bacterium]MBP6836805.1 L,D-transpeptidase [Kofleriaceae bacterium]
MKAVAILLSLFTSLTTVACAVEDDADPEVGGYEGVDFDEENPGANLEDGKFDGPAYRVPTNLPTLTAPEIIVSLDGLTVHLFDRDTGFQAVYPAGVGVLGRSGRSITPTGHFETGDDTTDRWWFVERRSSPAYFAGLPFLRLTAQNSVGANTYALHGPITDRLIRGYVSHGCVRMARQDIIDLFWMVRTHPSIPVTIQKEVERDEAGRAVDVGTTPDLYEVGDDIRYGASVGPRR